MLLGMSWDAWVVVVDPGLESLDELPANHEFPSIERRKIFDASRLSVISVWTGALAILCLVYIKRYALAIWLHGALAACFWTRIFAGADRESARAFGPYCLGELLNWIITDDLFPLFCIATLTSLMLIAASIGSVKLSRRASRGTP